MANWWKVIPLGEQFVSTMTMHEFDVCGYHKQNCQITLRTASVSNLLSRYDPFLFKHDKMALKVSIEWGGYHWNKCLFCKVQEIIFFRSLIEIGQNVLN